MSTARMTTDPHQNVRTARAWLSPLGSGECTVLLTRPMTLGWIEMHKDVLSTYARSAVVQELVLREQKTWETYLETAERVSESLGELEFAGMRFKDGRRAGGVHFRERTAEDSNAG